jgi:aspartyl-tRNA(Asn)/glutamyl-tRNA(Gln) amidotransferase subunit C
VSLTNDDLDRLTLLARLEITSDEVPDVLAKLTNIVSMVDQLQAADTTDVVPMAHPLDRSQRLRADEVTETDQRERYQRNAGMVDRDLYLVPKVID